LNSYFQPQTTEYFCGNCKKVTEHQISISIKDYPKYFIMSLKRFRYTRWNTKLSDRVFLPEKLDFLSFLNVDKQYELVAVLEHIGFFFRGHYKAYVKKKREWFLVDDKKIKKCLFGDVFMAQPYIFVYKLR
jgi:Ubiquitin C-terminal hydrolase